MGAPRIVLYCHNVSGLGHIVRTGQVAAAVARAGAATTLITGCRFLDAVPLDSAVSLERLPAARLERGVAYVADDPALRGADIIGRRGARILEMVRRVEPDVMLVDHNPVGLGGELLPTIASAIAERWPTRFVWGIAYVEGTAIGNRPPGNPRLRAAIAHYGDAFAYSDERDVPLLDECPAWALPPRARYVGTVAEGPPTMLPPDGRLTVVLAGGGSTAEDLWHDVAAARGLFDRSERPRVRFVVGPMGDAARIAAFAATDADVEVCATGTVADAIRDACVVVARAGYNTAAALMRTPLPIVFIPVTGVSRDQVGRAARLAGRPGVWAVEEDDPARRPRAVAEALRAALASGRIDRGASTSDGAANAAAALMQIAADAQAERALARDQPVVRR